MTTVPAYDSACEDEKNWLLALDHRQAAEGLQHQLWGQRDAIAAVVRHHLSLVSDDSCHVLPTNLWLCGGFNICIPVDVTRRVVASRLIFRCPRPHKLAEDKHPGTIDEKLACEVASYVWVQEHEHCDAIIIPQLYAFGFLNGTHVRRRAMAR